ncbi:MAG: T9SS type A sorting domain-containing protein [Bacteroidia bacterium]
MKQILFTVFALFATSFAFAQTQACTPDATIHPDSVGLNPDDLPDGQVGVAYDQVINIIMPQDTVTPIGTLKFCYFKIVSVTTSTGTALSTGLGLNHACGGAILDMTIPCQWNINHTPGFTNRGCVRISGVPTAIYDDSIVVNVQAGIGAVFGGVCTVAQTQDVPWKMPLKIIPANSIVGATAKQLYMQLYPNPSLGSAMLSFHLPENANVKVELFDMTGKRVSTPYNGDTEKGIQLLPISTMELASGLYSVKVTLDNGSSIISQTLAVQP